MELSELMRGAQEAMDRGEYQVASRACTHVLEVYPSCITAHRVLGESHLERGEADLATQHFDRTLEIDPLNVVARLGLGVACEERQDPSTAYMHYLNAWEMNPALEQVRDELLRLRLSLGREDRLHPTRAGLASIYARGGQLGRAAAEWRALLHADPDNVRSRSAFAEVLWRAGDDVGAAVAAEEALDLAPQNARLLAILADIERRRGGNADELVARYQEADPLGDLVAGLAELRPGTDFEFLRPGPLPIDPFDFGSVQATFAEPSTYAPGALSASHLPAPDLWDNLIKDFSGETATAGGEPVGDVVPFAWTEETDAPEAMMEGSILGDTVWPAAANEAAELASMSQAVAQAGQRHETNELNQIFAPPPELEPVVAEAEPVQAAQVEPTSVDPIAEMAFDLELAGSDEAPVAADAAPALPVDDLAAIMAEPAPPPAPPSGTGDDFDFEAALNEMNAAVPPLAVQASPFPDLSPPGRGASPDPRESPLPAPVDTVVATQMAAPTPVPTAPTENNPFITSDGRVDLTVGWDDLDRTLAEATPSDEAVAGYEHLLAEIDAGGIAPFAAAEPAGDESAWEPFTDDEVVAPDVAPELFADALVAESPAPTAVEADLGWSSGSAAADDLDLGDVASGFYDEDVVVPAEVAAALPPPGPSGYTEIFRHIDEETLEDFSDAEPVVDPLASPDLKGEPPDLADVLTADEAVAADLPLDLDSVDPDNMSVEQWLAGAGAPVAEPVAAAVTSSAFAEEGFDPLLSDFQDIEPFSYHDGGSGGHDGDSAVDFSEVNEGPFDPSQYSGIPDLAALHDPTRLAMVQPPVEDVALDAMFDEAEIDLGALVETPETALESVAHAEETAADELEVDDEVPIAPSRSWPAFVGMTSDLMDYRSRSGLFERLRAEKGALVEAGIVTVEASTPSAIVVSVTPAPVASQDVFPAEVPSTPAVTASVANEAPSHGVNLAMLRERLLESETSAREVADQLEEVVSRGTSDAAVMRALGEAYLKLGMSEQAAAQFRQAMLARRRAQ